MAFRPAYIPRTQHVDCKPLAYNVRAITWNRKDGKEGLSRPYLYFRIGSQIAKRCGFHKGDCIRVDFDDHAPHGRIIRVQHSSRHLCQGKSDWAMRITLPHTGDLLKHFPASKELVGLHILDTSVENGLIFELPKRPK